MTILLLYSLLQKVKMNLLEGLSAVFSLVERAQLTETEQEALKYAENLNPETIDILSCFGKRADHTLGNMFILYRYQGKAQLKMFDNFGYFSFWDKGTHKINGDSGQIFSLFTPEPVENITLSGFKYPLTEFSSYGGFVGVSNEFSDKQAEV